MSDIKKKEDCRYGFEGFPLCGRKAQPKENSAERLRIWRGEGRQGKVCNEAERNIQEIALLQDKLYAEGKEGVVFVLQAMDAAGKDGTVKHVFSGVNPQGVRVISFKQPSKEELSHDFYGA